MLNLLFVLFAFVRVLSLPSCNAWLVCNCARKIAAYRYSYQRSCLKETPIAWGNPSFRASVILLLAKVNAAFDNNDEKATHLSEEESFHWEELSAELLLSEDENDGFNDEWLPDREKARLKKKYERLSASKYSEHSVPNVTEAESQPRDASTMTASSNRPSPYTDEEEAIIEAMGGRTKRRKREPGFLGDSTLAEICTDYSVPISYLADVLCMWGVPVPIHIHDQLGDLVTGEQAFAIVEAVNTLDVAALHDRYSNQNIQQICYEWDIDLQQAFEMAMREGWSLPFGIHTCLRVEQERELLRILGSQSGLLDIPDDEYDDDY